MFVLLHKKVSSSSASSIFGIYVCIILPFALAFPMSICRQYNYPVNIMLYVFIGMMHLNGRDSHQIFYFPFILQYIWKLVWWRCNVIPILWSFKISNWNFSTRHWQLFGPEERSYYCVFGLQYMHILRLVCLNIFLFLV